MQCYKCKKIEHKFEISISKDGSYYCDKCKSEKNSEDFINRIDANYLNKISTENSKASGLLESILKKALNATAEGKFNILYNINEQKYCITRDEIESIIDKLKEKNFLVDARTEYVDKDSNIVLWTLFIKW